LFGEAQKKVVGQQELKFGNSTRRDKFDFLPPDFTESKLTKSSGN